MSCEDMTDSHSTNVPQECKENLASKLAHDLGNSFVIRTKDILTSEDVDFRSLLLPDFILRGLTAANFHRPSPIQLRSIPLLRLGLDLIVQSKAGTGKTLIIAVAALEMVKFKNKHLQAILVAPTREIAIQTKMFLSTISSDVPVKIETFIGGIPMKEDQKNLLGCQIAIGTPGRLNSLIGSGNLLLGHVRLFVLDEADKLMDKTLFSQVKSISKLLPSSKQTILCSATFLEPVREYVVKHMNEPFWVSAEDATRLQEGKLEPNTAISAVLLGVKQFVKEVPHHSQIVKRLNYKLEEILQVLAGYSFTQCIIFSNYQTRAETICHQLVSNGWPAMSIRGQDEQSHRSATLISFKELRCRVLLTTDVMSRGVDFRGVDLVINLDIPFDSATYLHRMGRAGRFGSCGSVITLASTGDELNSFKKILSEIKSVVVYALPDDLNLMKQDNDLLEEFYGPSSKSDKEDVNEEKQNLHHPLSYRDESLCKDEQKHIRKVAIDEVTKQSPQYAKPFEVSYSNESQRDKAVHDATIHLSKALCASEQPSIEFLTYEELENLCSSWTVVSTDDDVDSACQEKAKRQTNQKNWWTSANVVLTDAQLKLQRLREEAQEQPQICNALDVGSSEKSDRVSEAHLDQIDSNAPCNRSKARKKYKKQVHSNHLDEESRTNETPHDAKQDWKWDDSCNLYYLWDNSFLCCHLYNPYLKSYFKWDPKTNQYFKWNSELQNYLLWDCDAGRYSGISSEGYSSTSEDSHNYSSNVSYVKWFSLWNKHLKQLSSQVYQVEYVKNICDMSKKFQS